MRNKLNILIIGNDRLFLIRDIGLIGLTPIILNILLIYTVWLGVSNVHVLFLPSMQLLNCSRYYINISRWSPGIFPAAELTIGTIEIPKVVADFVISGSDIPEWFYKCIINGNGSRFTGTASRFEYL